QYGEHEAASCCRVLEHRVLGRRRGRCPPSGRGLVPPRHYHEKIRSYPRPESCIPTVQKSTNPTTGERLYLNMLPNGCQDKSRLLEEYQESANLYSLAVKELSEAIGCALKVDYILAQQASTQAKEKTEQARSAL